MAPGLQLPCRFQHIVDKNAVARDRVIHQHMGHRADELPVLQNGAAGCE